MAAYVDGLLDSLPKKILEQAATAVANEAKRLCGKDTLQLERSIHVIYPGDTDSMWTVTDNDGNVFDNSTGKSAGENEAWVVAKAQRPDGKDYAWYHEQAGRGPSFYLMRAANKARGSFNSVEIGLPEPL